MKKSIVYGIFIMFLSTTSFLTGSVAAGEMEEGKTLYDNMHCCALCHGKDGKGNGPVADAYTPRPADFTKARFWQRKDVDALITRTIRDGHSSMPPIRLTPQEVKALIYYMKHAFKPGE